MNKIFVVEIFNTSIGKIAILEFPDDNRPKVGMILKNSNNLEWKITGVGRGKHNTNLWDCRIETSSSDDLKIGDSLLI